VDLAHRQADDDAPVARGDGANRIARMNFKPSLAGLAVASVLALGLPATATAAAKPKQQLYVAIGDSYAAGVQALSEYDLAITKQGYANQIVKGAKAKGYNLKLINFGCGGVTSSEVFKQKGCAAHSRAIGGAKYKTTQAAAAERFLRRNRGRVALVTVSVGGNDATACAKDPEPIKCTGAAAATIKTNVTRLTKRLRKAAGPKVRIVGTTYPDVLLGQWVRPPVDQDLARLSVAAFRLVLNPAMLSAYNAGKAKFVDVTAATGAYGSLDETTTLAPYGTIPLPVAKVCQLTYYCQFGDIHPRTSGYKAIAKLVLATLPKRK
jgi:lysophospholipase L1-like esterase